MVPPISSLVIKNISSLIDIETYVVISSMVPPISSLVIQNFAYTKSF